MADLDLVDLANPIFVIQAAARVMSDGGPDLVCGEIQCFQTQI